MIFVIPAFKDLFKSFGADLPAPTLFVMAMSDFFVNVLVGSSASSAAAVYFFFRRGSARCPCSASWTACCSRCRCSATDPQVGRSRAGRARCRRCSPPACRWSRRSTRWAAPRATRLRRRDQARSRRKSRPAPASPWRCRRRRVPRDGAADGAIGEESGSLDAMLGKVADFYERRSTRRSTRCPPDGADDHRVPGRADRRHRGRDVPADLQAGPGRLREHSGRQLAVAARQVLGLRTPISAATRCSSWPPPRCSRPAAGALGRIPPRCCGAASRGARGAGHDRLGHHAAARRPHAAACSGPACRIGHALDLAAERRVVWGAVAGYLSLWSVYKAVQAQPPARKAWATATSSCSRPSAPGWAGR
jgi:hypothetical protein